MFRGLFQVVVACYILSSSYIISMAKKNVFGQVLPSPFVSLSFQSVPCFSHVQVYSLGSIPFLLIARTLCLSKLIYGQIWRLFGLNCPGADIMFVSAVTGVYVAVIAKQLKCLGPLNPNPVMLSS